MMTQDPLKKTKKKKSLRFSLHARDKPQERPSLDNNLSPTSRQPMLGSVPWQCHQGRGCRSQASTWLSGKSALQNDGNGDQNHRQTELGRAPGTSHHLPVYCLVSHSSHKDLSKHASPLSTDRYKQRHQEFKASLTTGRLPAVRATGASIPDQKATIL